MKGSSSTPKLVYADLGHMEYCAALSVQEQLVEVKQGEDLPDLLLFVEHPHVFTTGRGGIEANLPDPREVPLYHIRRGGDVTYHGPGQMVIYPLLDLRSRLRRDVHLYLRSLERVLIQTLRAFGITAKRMPPWTGVWIEEKKIAAIGIAVRRAITHHGLALNVNPDLAYFRRIVPCGLPWGKVTSMSQELGREASLATVKEIFLNLFVKHFHYATVEQQCLEDILIGLKSDPLVAPTTYA